MNQSESRTISVISVLKWGDFVIAFLIAFLAVLLLLLPGLASGEGSAAILLEDGNPIHVWSMEDLSTSGELEVDSHGYHYLVAWEGGRIRFAEADCPDLVCVHTGWVSNPNEIAACVPGHLILKIGKGDGLSTDQSEVDVIIK